MSNKSTEDNDNALQIALINVQSNTNVDRYVGWAEKSEIDLLVLSESPGGAHRGKANCAAHESDDARVAVYKINGKIEWKTPFVSTNHVVVKVIKPKLMLHAWYVPCRDSAAENKTEVFEAACREFTLQGSTTLHVGDMNSQRGKGRGTALDRASATGNFVNLNHQELPTFTLSGNRTRLALDWALASRDIADRMEMILRPEPHGSDHDLMIIKFHANPVNREGSSALRKIKPAVFLKEVKRLINEKGTERWHECKEQAAELAKQAYSKKQCVESVEMQRLTKEVEKLSKRIGKAKGALDHLKPELRILINQREMRRKQDEIERLHDSTASITNKNLWSRIKIPRGARKATFVQQGNEQLRGAAAGNRILEKSYPLRSRSPLKMPRSAPPDTTPITTIEVEQAVKRYSDNSAPGSDGISWKLLKQWHKRMPELFVTLFNDWYIKGIFPHELKEAMIVPLIKNLGAGSKVDNIRAISLLDTSGKWYEKILDTRMMYHLERLQLLSKDQFAYREQKNAGQALLQLIETHKESLISGKCEVILQVDVRGAFDNLHHQSIVDEASKHGLPSNMVRTLMTYLENRRSTISMDGETSTAPVLQGAAQGSALGPHLYLLATNRALRVATARTREQTSAEIRVVAFADDVVISARHETEEEVIKTITKFAETLAEQLKVVGLEVSPEKTNVMYISWVPHITSLDILGKSITSVKNIKVLGVTIKHNLDSSEHLKRIESKVRSKATAISKMLGNNTSTEHRKRVAEATLTSMVTYGVEGWYDPDIAMRERDTKLKSISKTIARTATNGPYTASSAALHVMADMMPLKYKCDQKRKLADDMRRGTCPLTGRTLEKRVLLGDLTHPSKWVSREIEACIMDDDDVNRIPAAIKYFTDGSKYMDDEGRYVTGAAFIKSSSTESTTEMLKLNEQSSVYQAEVIAIKAALADALSETHPTTIAIVSDSQSALTAIGQPRADNELVVDCQRAIKMIEDRGSRVILNWVKAHVGVAMNENADQAAKRAAVEGKPTLISTPISALKRVYREEAKNEYDEDYMKDKWGREIKKYVEKPSKRPREMTVTWQTAQVYSGHGLNRTSGRLGYGKAGDCPCGEKQSMAHVITECPIFIEQNIKYARMAGLSLDEFIAPWEELKENPKFYSYISRRAPTLALELKQCNGTIIEEVEISRALRQAFQE